MSWSIQSGVSCLPCYESPACKGDDGNLFHVNEQLYLVLNVNYLNPHYIWQDSCTMIDDILQGDK